MSKQEARALLLTLTLALTGWGASSYALYAYVLASRPSGSHDPLFLGLEAAVLSAVFFVALFPALGLALLLGYLLRQIGRGVWWLARTAAVGSSASSASGAPAILILPEPEEEEPVSLPTGPRTRPSGLADA